jgi:hypothetical protein
MLAASRRSQVSSRVIENAATVSFLLGGGMLVFLAAENLARTGASPETLIMTSMIGGGWLVWLVVRARRAQPRRSWRVADARYPTLVRVAQGISLAIPLVALAVMSVSLVGEPAPREGVSASLATSPSLLAAMAICLGIAYALRWMLEVRSHE